MFITNETCKSLSDHEIIKKSLENLDYFACLHERYESNLLRYIRRVSFVSEDEAKDILQDSFIKIWRNLNEFDSSLKLSSWIYRIVHNEAISFSRKEQSYGKNRKINLDDFKMELPEELDTETDLEQEFKITHDILNKLPIKYRDVLILKFFEIKSYAEISDILKIPEGTVAIRINRAKKTFKKIAGTHKMN